MQLLGRNCDTTPLPCIGRKERRSLGRKWEKGTLQKYNNFACYLKVILQPRFYLYRGWRPFCYPNSAFFHPFLFPVISETQTIGAKIRQGFFYWQSSFAPSFHLTHICKIQGQDRGQDCRGCPWPSLTLSLSWSVGPRTDTERESSVPCPLFFRRTSHKNIFGNLGPVELQSSIQSCVKTFLPGSGNGWLKCCV